MIGTTRGKRIGVTIIVPAKDEEAAIGDTLRSLPISTLSALGYDTDVVLLDGNSRDATREIAASLGATVIRDPEPGKGAAVRHARSKLKGDLVVMLDADGTYAPDAIPRVLGPLSRGEADIVMGERIRRPGSMSALHQFGNNVLSLGASLLYARDCPDVCTGLWGFRTEVLRALPLKSQGFELEAEMFALSARFDLRIANIEVDYLPRRGETKLSSTRDGFRIGWTLVRTRFAGLPSIGTTRTPRRVARHEVKS
ncbi:MAG: glycosyltransferase family 2 protein [Euryarchaeota archaeon]|nr:glycosyltransferase family 2 protein [Euryarchaeota archaeon]